MAQLIVRNVDEDIVRRLKLRAAEHGRSAEAEHREILREILRQVLRGGENGCSLKAFLLEMPDVGTDEDFARTRDVGRKVEL